MMTKLRDYNLLNEVVRNTNNFITNVPKSQRKKYHEK